ncbi:MAG: nitrous oxide reductase accessory protein NosL [Flavobacteriaceae bacterium]
MRRKVLLMVMIGLLSLGCKVEPAPMQYGSDSCHFCSMTIVDQQHAAQFVTKKGKAFKFDAMECMMNHLKQVDSSEVGLYLVNDYHAPGELLDATQAQYLISKGIPSPMGEFLTAFASKEAVNAAFEEHGGERYSWEELRNRFN